MIEQNNQWFSSFSFPLSMIMSRDIKRKLTPLGVGGCPIKEILI